jgi:hypothetical protein
MAIGNPISLTSNVATKTINVIATASQTSFTVTGGYRLNELSVFRNGVRLVNGRDFTARDGLTVTLLSAASEGDVLEFQVFDTFRVADAITPFDSAQTIAGDLSIVGVLSATQLGSVNFNLTSGIQTFHDVRVGGALTVAGVLTFDDVTNVDSVGYATFRSGINVQGAGSTTTTLNVTGVSTFASNVSIADSIFHTGDTNTAIRFPAADTFTVETGGSERIRVNSSGLVGVNTDSPGRQLTVSGGSAEGVIQITNNTSGAAAGNGFELLHFTSGETQLLNRENGAMRFDTNGTERLRITSDGLVRVPDNGKFTAGAGDDLEIYHDGSHSHLVSNTGNLRILADGSGDLVLTSKAGEEAILCAQDGAVTIKHDNSTKLVTTASGITVTGELECDTLDLQGNLDIHATRISYDTSNEHLKFLDNIKLVFGNGDDLQIFHDGSNSIINDGGTGNLQLQAAGTTRIEVTTSGATVTGTLNATTAVTQNGNALATNGKAIAMALIFG